MIVQGLATIFVDDENGTPVDITTSLTGHTGPSSNRASGNYHTLETLDPKVTRGGKTGNLTLTVLAELGADTPHAMLFDWHEDDDATARTIEVNEPDDEPGSTRYVAEYFPTGDVVYTTGVAGSTDPRTSQYTFSREGALTRTTIA